MTSKLRPLILTILLLSLVAAGLPFGESLAHWGRRASMSRRRGKHRYHRHTRAWWRRHRARLRDKQLRAMRRRTRPAATAAGKPGAQPTAAGAALGITKVSSAVAPAPPQRPVELSLPASWNETRGAGGEMKFALASAEGQAAGTAVLAPMTPPPAEAESAPSPRASKPIAGVSLAALRRTVIDRMVAEGGWVVNDLVREIQGRRVFIVLAQTGAGGVAQQARTFYFAEVDGRLYSLVTDAPVGLAAPVAADSEKLLASLRPKGSPAVASQK